MRPKRRLLRRRNLRISPHIRWIPYKRCTTACGLPRRATPWGGCYAITTLGVPQSLPREKEQHHQQAENGVPEDKPGDAQPATLAGKQPGQHGDAERERDDKPEDPNDGDQLAELGR